MPEVGACWCICGLRETGVPETSGAGKLGGTGAGEARRDFQANVKCLGL